MDKHLTDDKQHEVQSESVVPQYSPQVDALTFELLGQIADKWTLLVLEELAEHGLMRFTELRRRIPNISQKMLTQTLRRLEQNGLVERRVHAVIPPRVEYQRTELGHSLGVAVCALWTWVEDNADSMGKARQNFESNSVR
ncbi:MAG: helix-turn-helix transcriptional regulator [Pseudomonadota bacterium]|nr:helix-turn-helix transcriptional regulator [Pseudomonadota bacterium]